MTDAPRTLEDHLVQATTLTLPGLAWLEREPETVDLSAITAAASGKDPDA